VAQAVFNLKKSWAAAEREVKNGQEKGGRFMLEAAVEQIPDAIYERVLRETFGEHAGPWIADRPWLIKKTPERNLER
jgi:hypothetical protein